MPPQKTQPAQVITDGDDRHAEIVGLLRHILDELHLQNKTAAGQYNDVLNPMYGQLADVRAILDRLSEVVEEARPLLESPVAKFMAQRRALKHPKAAPGAS